VSDAPDTFAEGAGIAALGPTTVLRTTISGNGGPGAREGGGLYHSGAGTTPLAVADSTISGNTATELGAGLSLHQDAAAVTNATVSGNRSVDDDDANSPVFIQNGVAQLGHATVAGNPQQNGAAFRLHTSSGLETATLVLRASAVHSAINREETRWP